MLVTLKAIDPSLIPRPSWLQFLITHRKLQWSKPKNWRPGNEA